MTYQFKNINVLVIESNHAMFDLAKAVLTTFGVPAAQVHSAYSFEEGFEAFCRLNPDLVIVDWLSEPNNGLKLTRKMRTDKRSPNPFIPVIMMTGYGQKTRVLKARDSGITEFLVKPFTSKALYLRIEQIIERPRQFVRADTFVGPDRRRQDDPRYQGPKRREEDAEALSKKTGKSATDIARHIRDKS